MSPLLIEWLNLLIRWAHLIFGIWWIGSSIYFVWLDNSFEPPKEPREGLDGEVYMVHGGFYYLVEKRLMQPGKMPDKLHWFKWEATFTWITGMMLLTVVYYLTGGSYLIDPKVRELTVPTAIGLSLAAVIGSWLIYDLIWQTLGKKNVPVGTALTLGLGVLLSYGLCHTFSGRAAYIHMGAIMGTIMVANVWVRILPGQRRMLDDALAGKTPDYSQGKFAKVRSLHNSYMTYPVVFLMISNHFAMTFGDQYNWVIILLLTIFGAGIRHYHITAEKHQPARWVGIPVLLAFACLVVMTLPERPPQPADNGGEVVKFAEVHRIVSQRCTPCHSSEPSDTVFTVAPLGMILETREQLIQYKDKIKSRAIDSNSMPLGNKTNMTDEERETLGRWLAQQNG